MPVGDVFKVTTVLHNDDSGEDLSFGIHVAQTALEAPGIEEMGAAVVKWWNAGEGTAVAYKEYMTTDMDLIRVTLRRIDPLEPIELIYDTGLPISGTSTSDPGPPQACALVSLRTAKIGRSYRGRMYLPCPTEPNIDTGGALLAATASDIAEGIEELFEDLSAGGGQPVVWSAVLGESNDITTIFVDRRVRGQRRRANEAPIYVGTE